MEAEPNLNTDHLNVLLTSGSITLTSLMVLKRHSYRFWCNLKITMLCNSFGMNVCQQRKAQATDKDLVNDEGAL